MSKNLHRFAKAQEKIEFTPHALGEIKGDISREEIYQNHLETTSKIPTINPFDQTADQKTNER